MSEFPQAAFLTSADQPHQFVADTGAEIAFAGRSNAGKSSAINTLVERRQFARTSKTPGRTQLINFFDLGPGQRIVDLPGYGFARVAPKMRDHWKQLMEHYFEARESLAGLFLMMDIRRGVTDFDDQMLRYATDLGVPAHVLLTKSDKLKRGPANEALFSVRKTLAERASVQLFSSLTRAGADEARVRLREMLETDSGTPGGDEV